MPLMKIPHPPSCTSLTFSLLHNLQTKQGAKPRERTRVLCGVHSCALSLSLNLSPKLNVLLNPGVVSNCA